MPKHADPQEYWERRSQFSEPELARLFLPAAGVSDWLVDTGLDGEASGIAGVAELNALSGNRVHEVVRLEQVAEQAALALGRLRIGLRGDTAPTGGNSRGHQIHSGLPRRV